MVYQSWERSLTLFFGLGASRALWCPFHINFCRPGPNFITVTSGVGPPYAYLVKKYKWLLYPSPINSDYIPKLVSYHLDYSIDSF